MFAAGRQILWGAAFTLAGVAAPSVAVAGNGIHPRTPVKWEPAPACMTVVDRTVDAKLSLTYTIPYEDTEVTADEVADSRRHQFIGFCRGNSLQEPLPAWLSQADVAAAAAMQLVKPEDLGPEDVFETSAAWKDCWFRITGDDERRPITFEEAMKPVVWDTTLLPVGGYVVAGYTWEPVFNIWSRRPGVIKVIDDLDPAKSPPALALMNEEQIKYRDEVITLFGCLDAMDGSTIAGFWSRTGGDVALDWQMFAGDVPVSGDSFELEFVLPPATFGQQIAVKVEVTDPLDRRFTAHLAELATVLDFPTPGSSGGCEDGMAFIHDPGCGDSGGSEGSEGSEGGVGSSSSGGGGGSSSGGGSETGGAGEQPGAGGCSCGVGGGLPPALLVGLGGLLARRRRRR